MAWHGTPYTIPLILAAASLAALALHTHRRVHIRGVGSASLLLLATAEWMAAYALELTAADLPSKLLWARLQYPGIVAVPPLWAVFTLRYSGQDRRLTPALLVTMALVPLLTLLLVLTNDLHSLIWSRAALETRDGFLTLALGYGPAFWLHALYAYGCLAVGSFVLVGLLIHSRRLYRWQASALLFVVFLPWLGNAMYLSGLNPLPGIDPTPLAFAVAGVALVLTVSRLRLEDIVAVSLGSVVEVMGDGVLVLDAQNRIAYLNPAAHGILGPGASRAIGEDVSRAWPEWPGDAVHPCDVPVSLKGDPRTYNVAVSPLVDWRGSLVSRIVVLRDVTDRKRAEEALRRSEERYRTLVETGRDVIFTLAPDGTFTSLSPAHEDITGWSAAEWIGRPFVDLIHPEDLLRAREIFAAVLRGENLPTFELRVRSRSGAYLVGELAAAPLMEGVEVVGFVGVGRDVTERKRREEQSGRAERLEASARVAARVAHEFNNLLGPLVGYPELIKRWVPQEAAVVRLCDAMLQAAQLMADINQNMMILGGRGHLDDERVDLNQVVGQALHRASLPPGVVVNLELVPDLSPVRGSPGQLLQVIANLISNAREAMANLGVLTLRTENLRVEAPMIRYSRVEPGEYVRLTVADTGCGIPPEIRGKVFDAFVSTRWSTQRRDAGLGLSIVQAIVADHGGRVDLESEVGKGSSFAVYLPAASSQPPEAARKKGA